MADTALLTIFRCPHCSTALPGWPPTAACATCGSRIARIDDVLQFTDDPVMQAEGEYTYLGYDAIAQGYADLCEPPQLHAQLYAAYAAAITAHVPARGLLLDLGCGPGFYARALAKHGLRVIAGDISQQMLALSAHPPLPAAILPCRLNA